MLCISCKTDIPPAWVACIQSNICPACAGPIMDDSAKELLAELKQAMEKMPNDPSGLAGWLLSNYTLRKIGEAQPVEEFYGRKTTKKRPAKHNTVAEDEVEEFPGLKVNNNNPVQKFLENAGVAKTLEKRKSLQELASMINNGEVEEDLYGSEESEDENYDEEYDDDYSPTTSLAKQAFNNDLTIPAAGKQPLSQEEIIMMAQALQKNSGTVSAGEIALQEARKERLRKQREIARGGSAEFGQGKGTFRRG